MQAVILAAGKGERMRPLTDNTPKPMLRIKGRPILEYTLSNLPEAIAEFILVVGYKNDLIKDYFGYSYRGREIKYIPQLELNGTAGALFQAKHLLKDRFLVLNGDDLYHYDDISKVLPYDFCILTKEINHNLRNFGVVKVDERKNLVEIIEKPTNPENNLANIGVYSLTDKIFDYKPVPINEREFGLPQTLVSMARDYSVRVEKADFWHPIGYPEDLQKAEEIIHHFVLRL